MGDLGFSSEIYVIGHPFQRAARTTNPHPSGGTRLRTRRTAASAHSRLRRKPACGRFAARENVTRQARDRPSGCPTWRPDTRPMTPLLTNEHLEAIVERIFVERQSTLLSESAAFHPSDLADSCLEFRSQMLPCLESLPISAFHPVPDREPGEAGWTAGEIVSHNSDRLLWTLHEAMQTVGLDDAVWLSAPEVVVCNASREPRPLDRGLSLRILEKANEYEKAVLPPLPWVQHRPDGRQNSPRPHECPVLVAPHLYPR